MLLRNLALASSLAIAAVPAAAYAAPQAAAAQTVQVSTPKAGTSAETKSYAEREQLSTQAADFQGGDIVVIGVSGGALVVLLFLLLILV